MKKTALKPGRPRRLTEEEKVKAWEFKLAVLGPPHRCAVCGHGTTSPDAHHVISADWLRRNMPDRVYDRRNALPTCRDCHERHENASQRIPRRCLRPENEQFAKELGLEHLLDRYYEREPAQQAPPMPWWAKGSNYSPNE